MAFIKKYNIPTDRQMLELSQYINDNFNDIKRCNMYIVFELPKELIKQLDEDYYIKNKIGDVDEFIPSDEVNINFNNVKFKFVEEGDGKEQE